MKVAPGRILSALMGLYQALWYLALLSSTGRAGRTITHLAFYAGWPSAMTAVTLAKDVFENK